MALQEFIVTVSIVDHFSSAKDRNTGLIWFNRRTVPSRPEFLVFGVLRLRRRALLRLPTLRFERPIVVTFYFAKNQI